MLFTNDTNQGKMFSESVWSNLTDLFSYVDPIINRNLNEVTTLWQDFVNASILVFNNAYQSFAAQVDISHFVEHVSNLTLNGFQIAKNATETIGNEIIESNFDYVFVPIGNGSLISGIGNAVKDRTNNT